MRNKKEIEKTGKNFMEYGKSKVRINRIKNDENAEMS